MDVSWRHVRAVLVALHLVAVLLAAMPSTGGLLHRSAWKAPSAQEEFAVWAERLSGFGVSWTSGELEDVLWTVASGYDTGITALRRPFGPYYRWCGTQQGWMMFPAPERNPAILQIQVREKQRWRTVYAGRSDEYTWQRAFFDQDRIRTQVFLFGWPHMHRSRAYRNFGAYLAPRLRADHPDATTARLRFRRSRSRTPAEVLDGVELPARFVGTQLVELRP